MGLRTDFHNVLCGIMSNHGFSDASQRVYFQPPEGYKMKFPCIVYELSKRKTEFATNKPYNIQKGYTLTIIDSNPDSIIPDSISMLPMCSFDRRFVVDNLYHDVYTIYY